MGKKLKQNFNVHSLKSVRSLRYIKEILGGKNYDCSKRNDIYNNAYIPSAQYYICIADINELAEILLNKKRKIHQVQ